MQKEVIHRDGIVQTDETRSGNSGYHHHDHGILPWPEQEHSRTDQQGDIVDTMLKDMRLLYQCIGVGILQRYHYEAHNGDCRRGQLPTLPS